MSDRLEDIFTSFADEQEDSLKELGMTKDEFITNAKEWSKTEDGKLEIQKFILEQEIKELENNINKKKQTINEIEEELQNL